MKDKFWNGKKVLVTGHTGFLGSWLSIWLNELGASVIGYSLSPNTDNDNYVAAHLNEKVIDLRGDVRDIENLQSVFYEQQPEIIFHTHMQLDYDINTNPAFVYESNVMGTLNVLECIRNTQCVKVGIMQNSDKCYAKKEQIWGYRECDRLGDNNIYSASEACAELVAASYVNEYMNINNYDKHKKAVSTVRIGDTIGGGDWIKSNVVPKSIMAFENNDAVVLNNAQNVRCWQHVLEPISGMLILAKKMYEDPINYSESWNFGAEYTSCATFYDIAEKVKKEFKSGDVLELDEEIEEKINRFVMLDTTKAKCKLGWKQRWNLDKTIKYTTDWYKEYKNDEIYQLCVSQIERYALLL